MIFRKIGCLVVTSNLVKLKSISSWPKIIAKTTENDFRFHFHFEWYPALENRRERERKSKKIADVEARRSHQSKTIAPLRSFKPTLVEPSHWSSRSSRHFRTMREERDRESREIVAPQTHSHRWTHSHQRTHSHRKPTRIDEPWRTHSHRQTHSHPFVLVLVWTFCNKICLWFWFFTFSLWSLILLLLLLLWWRGWWCFGGFPVVWWWVLWGVVVENSIFRVLPNTWNYFLEKFS